MVTCENWIKIYAFAKYLDLKRGVNKLNIILLHHNVSCSSGITMEMTWQVVIPSHQEVNNTMGNTFHQISYLHPGNLQPTHQTHLSEVLCMNKWWITHWVNSLSPNSIMCQWFWFPRFNHVSMILVNTSSGNGLVPPGSKPLYTWINVGLICSWWMLEMEWNT